MLKPKKKSPFKSSKSPDEIKKKKNIKRITTKAQPFSSCLTKKPESQNPRKTH
jgi:hypothetical protein